MAAEPTLHFCRRGGLLVGVQGTLPDAPEDYAWPSLGPDLGCTRLRCAGCDGPVRQRPGWVARRQLTPDEVLALGAVESWPADDPRVRPASRTRLYYCDCGVSWSTKDTVGAEDEADDRRLPVPASWRCAGHPALALPVVVDGVDLSADTDWTALVTQVARAEVATERPAFTRHSPAAWFQRLHHTLADADAATAVASAALACAASEPPELRAVGLDFAFRVPLAPGAQAIEALVDAPGAALASVARPDVAHWTLGGLLQEALAARIRALEIGSPARAAALDAARRAAEWATEKQAQLQRAIARAEAG